VNDRRFAAGALGAALAAIALLWLTRAAPLDFSPYWRVDALSTLFVAATAASLVLAPAGSAQRPTWRELGAAALLLLAYSSTLTPLIAGCYTLLALLGAPEPGRASRSPGSPRGLGALAALPEAARQLFLRAPWPLAAVCLWLGYGALAVQGALNYAGRSAGAALGSFVFWFVLLAAVLPLLPSQAVSGTPPSHRRSLLTIAWYYPLARLYSLGPWNTGWSFATLLLGGALAGWCAIAALAQPSQPARSAQVVVSYLGLALAGLGLSTSAGIAAGGFALLVAPVLAAGLDRAPDPEDGAPSSSAHHPAHRSAGGTAPALLAWLLAGALPLSAPFVALWMLIGASLAAGVPLLAGLAWLIALLNGLTIAVWGSPASQRPTRARLALAGLSAALGAGAPLVVRGAIEPVVAQLQGGLTPYGDFTIWPWVGLAALDASHTQATTLPSIAIALLVLVLAALIYLIARVYHTHAAGQPALPGAGVSAPSEWLRILRDEVPWLGALLGSQPPENASHERE
jgi:hypothetical protein